MKLKLLTALVLGVALWIIAIPVNDAHSNSSGPSAGKTGSPGDGVNCTQCHSGTATTVPSLIAINAPGAGYVPGTTYQVTATVGMPNINKFGFQVSPQNTSGQQKGTLVATNTAETQTLVSGKYITHKLAGTNGTGSRTWTFDWTAPASGSGPVTFYGAFVCANNNGQNSGDQVLLSSTTLQEDLSSLIESDNMLPDLSLFPVPASDFVEFRTPTAPAAAYTIAVYDISGALVQTTNATSLNGFRLNISTLSKGVYIVKVHTTKGITVRRILKS